MTTIQKCGDFKKVEDYESMAKQFFEFKEIEKDCFSPAVLTNSRQGHHSAAYGGLIFSQALAAAENTVDEKLKPHSTHSYFILSVDTKEPISYNVKRARDGKSFATRTVDAIQNGKIAFVLQVSFHIEEKDSIIHQSEMPKVPPPESLMSMRQAVPFMKSLVEKGEISPPPAMLYRLKKYDTQVYTDDADLFEIHTAVDSGKNVRSLGEFFDVLTMSPILKATSVYRSRVERPVELKTKPKIDKISSLYDFVFLENFIIASRYKGIGGGLTIKTQDLNPNLSELKIEDKGGVLVDEFNENEEADKIMRGEESILWYQGKCSTSTCSIEDNSESDKLLPQVKDDENVQKKMDDKFFYCPTPGCSASYTYFRNLEKHILLGKHNIAPERTTLRDYSINLFSRKIEDLYPKKTTSVIVNEALNTLYKTVNDNDPILPQGWAIKRRQTNARWLIAYNSDSTLLSTATSPHYSANFLPTMLFSLDHCVWFHKTDLRADEWLLFETQSHVANGSRAFIEGKIWRRDGTLMASCTQEALVRSRDEPSML